MANFNVCHECNLHAIFIERKRLNKLYNHVMRGFIPTSQSGWQLTMKGQTCHTPLVIAHIIALLVAHASIPNIALEPSLKWPVYMGQCVLDCIIKDGGSQTISIHVYNGWGQNDVIPQGYEEQSSYSGLSWCMKLIGNSGVQQGPWSKPFLSYVHACMG